MITRLRRLRFRLRRGVAEQGLVATVRAGLRRFLGAEFEFVWYAAEPARIRRLRLRKGYEFRIATEAEVTAWLTAVPAIDPPTGPNRIREGAWLCFILREGEPIFNCSVFTDRYPLDEVAGGWYALGDGVACVDDALTDRSARGLAIAPMAYAQIADRLESQGFEALITKVERGQRRLAADDGEGRLRRDRKDAQPAALAPGDGRLRAGDDRPPGSGARRRCLAGRGAVALKLTQGGDAAAPEPGAPAPFPPG